ncbi:MAG: PQQ-binding-like beta-propeller repeat protein, partial [Pseudomonadales bacterium]
QKSGMVHALDPDTGKLLWQTRVGRGGIQGGVHFGMASANGRLFVPVTDMDDGRSYAHPARPGVHALDIATGKALWYAPVTDVCNGRPACHPGYSQAISEAGGLVYAGGMDGMLRVYDAQTGAQKFAFDTTESFVTVSGGRTSGGSFGGAAGPLVVNGTVYISSGYGIYNHMAGNLMMALRPQPQ